LVPLDVKVDLEGGGGEDGHGSGDGEDEQ